MQHIALYEYEIFEIYEIGLLHDNFVSIMQIEGNH